LHALSNPLFLREFFEAINSMGAKWKVWFGQGHVQGGDWGDRLPPKTYKSNFFHHDFLQFRKQHSWYEAFLSSIILSQQCFEVYFISLTVAKPLWDLTTKYYWNRPPGWIRPRIWYSSDVIKLMFVFSQTFCRLQTHYTRKTNFLDSQFGWIQTWNYAKHSLRGLKKIWTSPYPLALSLTNISWSVILNVVPVGISSGAQRVP